MRALPNRVSFLTHQHINDMLQAESEPALLLNPVHARKKFLGKNRPVECFAGFETIVTAAAWFRKFLAKIAQQRRPAAISRLSVSDHSPKLLMSGPLFRFALVFDEAFLLN